MSYIAQDSAVILTVVDVRVSPPYVDLQSPIRTGIITISWSRKQRGCEITVSEQLSTYQSDPRWQATLLVPTLITQINIKLNTRPCSVNFYVVKNDWLFASLHQRDQSTGEGYQSIRLSLEVQLSSFYPPCIYNCQYSVSAVPITSVDMSHTILCDMYLANLAGLCGGTVWLSMQHVYKRALGVDLLYLCNVGSILPSLLNDIAPQMLR